LIPGQGTETFHNPHGIAWGEKLKRRLDKGYESKTHKGRNANDQ